MSLVQHRNKVLNHKSRTRTITRSLHYGKAASSLLRSWNESFKFQLSVARKFRAGARPQTFCHKSAAAFCLVSLCLSSGENFAAESMLSRPGRLSLSRAAVIAGRTPTKHRETKRLNVCDRTARARSDTTPVRLTVRDFFRVEKFH